LCTQNSLGTKQIQHWPLLLCPFPAVLKARGHHLILEVTTDWNAVDLAVNREIIFCCNIRILVTAELYLLLSKSIFKLVLPKA
uniref:Uncharacterized protein n=1 Tax=Malurus cyaneus samueli TaxID=2593467 RepID=A0A8C5TH46_9PASS